MFREDNAMFLVECPGGKRTREVLEKIILEHVEKGTTIKLFDKATSLPSMKFKVLICFR